MKAYLEDGIEKEQPVRFGISSLFDLKRIPEYAGIYQQNN